MPTILSVATVRTDSLRSHLLCLIRFSFSSFKKQKNKKKPTLLLFSSTQWTRRLTCVGSKGIPFYPMSCTSKSNLFTTYYYLVLNVLGCQLTYDDVRSSHVLSRRPVSKHFCLCIGSFPQSEPYPHVYQHFGGNKVLITSLIVSVACEYTYARKRARTHRERERELENFILQGL